MENRQEQEHLEYILKALEQKITEIQKKIGDVNKDMEDMNEYFWENYNEFDEYGYEEYDNQTAYLMRSRERDESFEELKRYKKMVSSPYFAKIVFTYEGDDEPEEFYIGIGNFSEESDMIPLIFDWRAPVCSLFYDYDKGEASYEAPSGILTGEINEKMQFKIKHSKMIYAISCDVKIDDDILRSALAGNADAKLKSIVTSIQKEQNAIIRNTKDKIMVIQGCAGSGKTSIALHRIAYLLYHNRQTLKASNVLILSPNGVFADYISHILPELGEENISEMSFDTFAYHQLKDIREAEDIYDHLERMIALARVDISMMEAYEERFRQKQSKEFMNEINGFVLRQEYELIDFRRFKYNGIEKDADFIADMFYEKFPDTPILSRLNAIADYLIDEEETLKDRDYSPEDRDEVYAKINRMYETTSLLVLYNRFLQEMGYEELLADSAMIPYEDVYPMLYLKYKLWGRLKVRPVRHLVIDEMQDYSYLQLKMIEVLFGNCPMTILGDKAQSMAEKKNDVRDFIRQIFGKEVKQIEINKSYRSTKEITEFAAGITGEQNVIPFDRHGEEPKAYTFINEEEKLAAIAEKIKENKEAETIAVLVLDKDKAFAVSEVLKKLLDDKKIVLLDKDSQHFSSGIVVTTYYMAKGLEFDSVYLADAEDIVYQTDFGKQAMYISATRALHSFDTFSVAE